MENTWNKIREIVTKLRGLTTLGIADVTGNAIAAIFWFFIATFVGAENYGQISYFLAIAGIGSALSLVGAGNTLMVYIAKGIKIQSSVFFVSLIFGAVSSIILFFIFYKIELSLVVLGYVVFNLAISEMLGKKLYQTYARYVIIQKALMVGLAISLYYLFGPNGVILGIGLSFFPYIMKIFRGFKEEKISFSLIKPRFGFMLNSYVLDLSNAFVGSIDKIIIVPIFGFVLLGNYQLGVQFLAVLYIIPNIFYKYLLSQEASGNSMKVFRRGIVVISFILALASIILSPILLPTFFPVYTEAVKVLQIISLAIIPNTINLIFISKFLALEKSKIVVGGSGTFLLVQITSIIILGQLFGINGVAVALVLAELAQTAYFLGAQKIVKIPMS